MRARRRYATSSCAALRIYRRDVTAQPQSWAAARQPQARKALARPFAFTGIVTVMLAGEVIGQDGSSAALALSGDFLRATSVPVTGQEWFAVNQTPSGMALSETRIELAQVTNACAGTATRIKAVDVREPLFLVSGLPALRAGPLDSVFDEPRFIYPAEGISLSLESGAWFGVRAYGSAAPAVGEVRITDYEIRIYQGTRTQTLARFPQIDWDGPPQLVWAGDLDRDGNLDALFDLRTHYAGHHYVLFVSSEARDELLVRSVAEFSVSGC